MAGAAAYLVVGLALEHAAYIIQYGSIFDRQRAWLTRHSRWLGELVYCQLCTITQLAFWWIALPLAWIGRDIVVAYPVASVVGLVMVWFSVAAVGLACYDIMRLVGRGTDALVLLARKHGGSK